MDKEQPKLGINLLVRNLERNLTAVLNDFRDVPIEMQRIVMQGLLDKITNIADQTAQKELAEYHAVLQKQEAEIEKQEE